MPSLYPRPLWNLQPAPIFVYLLSLSAVCAASSRQLSMTDDLHNLKDDMTAFIEGHGMRRFPGYVGDEVSSVLWKDDDNPDAWKDFVELAKASGAPFVTMDDIVLTKEDLDFLIDRLKDGVFTDDLEDARWLRTYVGKTGFLQLGFAHQGTLFLYEVSTEWYDRYQRILDTAEAMGGLLIEEDDDDDE